jgi:hypothetical protein
MQIFEINKKIQMFWFFLALPLFPRKKALESKKTKSRGKDDNFLLITAMPKQTRPYKDITFALGRAKGLLFLKTKKKNEQQDTLHGSMHD